MSKANKQNSEKYGVYMMTYNTYLGDCLTIVYKASEEEIEANGLTGENILLLIKPSNLVDVDKKDYDIRELLEKSFNPKKPLVLRIGSECLFGVYGDSHCDCESQRIASLNAIKAGEQGIYIHMPQEAQGRGLHYKAQELALQVSGHDPIGEFVGKQSVSSASKMLLGHSDLDIRSYGVLKAIISDLGLDQFTYRLITGNPDKIKEVSGEIGIKVTHSLNVSREITPENIGEFLGKLYSRGQEIDHKELERIFALLEDGSSIPERAYIQLAYIKDDHEAGRDFDLGSSSLEKLISYAPDSAPTLDYMLSSQREILEDTTASIDLSANIRSEGVEVGYIAGVEIFGQLKGMLKGKFVDYLALEGKKHYDVLDDNSLSMMGRQVKIRRTENIIGMEKDCIERLIYKIDRMGEGGIETINVELDKESRKELLSKYEQLHENETISHVCKIEPGLILVIKVLPNFDYLLDISGAKDKVEGFSRELEENCSVERIEIKYFEDSYGRISKFQAGRRERLIEREKELVTSFLKD